MTKDHNENENLKDAQENDAQENNTHEGETTPHTAEDTSSSSALEATSPSLEEQLAQTKEQLLRTLAELENTRKRAQREKEETAQFAITKFAREILNVADNLDRAVNCVQENDALSENAQHLLKGVEMTRKDFFNTLEKFNIVQIDALNQPFDPHLHQAMFEVPDAEKEPGIIVQEVQKGFKIGERLLRPALVGVTKAPQ